MDKIEIICTLIGTVAVILGGVWFIVKQAFKFGENAQRLTNVENRLTNVESNTGEIKLSINNIEKKLFDSEKRISLNFEKSINRLPCASHSEDLLKIKSILIQKYPSYANVLSIKASPRQLNELGMKIFNEIDGTEFLAENKETLFKFITESKPLAELDVEQFANGACMSLTTTTAFNKIKDYVYNASPVETAEGKKYEIDLNDVCFVLSIALRDMYLNEIGLEK